MSSLDKLTVLGAGLLGGQIAWHSAFKGNTAVGTRSARCTSPS
jgi:3-hydroxyacyl-CoA dehydrogenase